MRLPVQLLTQNLIFPLPVSYSSTNFGGAYAKIYACLRTKKKVFVMQHLVILGLMEMEESRRKFTKPQEAPFLHHFAMNELSSITFCSRVLAARVGEIKLRDACRMPQGNPLITLCLWSLQQTVMRVNRDVIRYGTCMYEISTVT